ncbi:MAG: alpha-E domain-containing protein, partial [Pseudomonadota bacterium]|nr:alpha-E domain-containing protein [Pseudomonadota bacterium]
MLGRVANNLYWMARYLERAENNARLIETAFRRSLSRTDDTNDEWDSVLSLIGARKDYDALHEICDQA